MLSGCSTIQNAAGVALRECACECVRVCVCACVGVELTREGRQVHCVGVECRRGPESTRFLKVHELVPGASREAYVTEAFLRSIVYLRGLKIAI